MPQTIVRQFTARKFDENAATMPKKKTMPASAWPRRPIVSRVEIGADADRGDAPREWPVARRAASVDEL